MSRNESGTAVKLIACDVGIDARTDTVRNDLSDVEAPALGRWATRRRKRGGLMARDRPVE